MTNAEKCKRWRNRNPAKVDAKSLARMKKERAEARFTMRARLAKRDLDYAESPCAARVTVDCVVTW